MLYKTKLYISEVTNLSDARYAAGMQVDYIGFPLDLHSEKHIDIITFNAIVGWLEGIHIIAEFDTLSTQKINQLIAENQLKIVSIPFERINDASEINAQVILKNASESTTLLPENVIFTTQNSITKSGNYFLENCDFSQLDTAVEHAKGIVLKGSEEERPGYKDYDQLAEIIEYLEI